MILYCLKLQHNVHRFLLLSSVIFAFSVPPVYGFEFTFNNLNRDFKNDKVNNAQDTNIELASVVTNNRTALDLIMAVVDNYQANNKVINDYESQITLEPNISTTFDFKFIETGTTTSFGFNQFDVNVMNVDLPTSEIIISNYDVSDGKTSNNLGIATLIEQIEFTAKSNLVNEIIALISIAATQQQSNYELYNNSQFDRGYEYTTVGRFSRNFLPKDLTIDATNLVNNRNTNGWTVPLF